MKVEARTSPNLWNIPFEKAEPKKPRLYPNSSPFVAITRWYQ